MRKFVIVVLTAVLSAGVQASWYWPFDSDSDAVDEKPKRVSELIEPASLLIEEASDLAAEDKVDEAIEKYRKALEELNRIEMENPDRAKGAEFATLRNKRAYVNAAIDSLLLGQVRSNAKVVAVSDTTELERRLDRERWGKRLDTARGAIDRRDSDKALSELEKAKAGTTNVVQIAVTCGVIAGAYCQKGEFEKACRFLEMYLKELVRTGVGKDRNVLTVEERQLVEGNLRIVRDRVVGGYGRSFADGRQACEDSARLGTLDDLTTTNAIALASNVVVRLDALRKDLNVFAFPQARKLDGVASGLRRKAFEQLGRMQETENPTSLVWRLNVAGLKTGLEALYGLSNRVEAVDRRLSAALRLVDGPVSKPREGRACRDRARTVSDATSASLPFQAGGFATATDGKQKAKTESKLSDPVKPPRPVQPARPSRPTKSPARREKVLSALSAGDWTTARRLIDEMLVEKPNGAAALNLKAAMEAKQGKFREAEDTLDQAIVSNPRNHFAYYNMAKLMLQVRADDKSAAKRYYETGRALGGPVDAQLEEAFK